MTWEFRSGRPRRGSWIMLAAASVVLAVAAWWWQQPTRVTSAPDPARASAGSGAGDGIEPPQRLDLARVRPEVDQFCGACHAVPLPTAVPRDAWFKEVERGYYFYFNSGRTDLTPPPVEDVVAYYQQQAPVRLEVPTADQAVGFGPIRFRRDSLPLPGGEARPADVSHLRHWAEGADGEGSLLFTDMHSGSVGHVRFDARVPTIELDGRLSHPGHVEPVDLDQDGVIGLLVAELGSREPADHANGKVVWLAPSAAGIVPVVLCEQLGRVADVQAADFDDDGDLDLVVAEFGWHSTGRILLLRRDGNRDGKPHFSVDVLDERHGAIHVPVADLDGDGRLDFIALISQEHEVIEAFINQGGATFRIERIYDARDPAHGSSGIQAVDMDGDGDIDVLHTNGDSFDSFHLKPYHGVRWLENTGGFPFRSHELAVLPGVHRALTMDLDDDGDQDIAACAFLPSRLAGDARPEDMDSVIWLEQTSQGGFERHVIERGSPLHATMAVADIDKDGKLDIIVGNFSEDESTPLDAMATVYWNEGPNR